MSPDLDTVERGRDGGTVRGSDVVRQQAVEGGKRVRRTRRDRGQNSTGANEEKDWVRAWGGMEGERGGSLKRRKVLGLREQRKTILKNKIS